MKLQWIKDIVGDAYTEEIDGKVSQALGERFVARADFNDKATKLKESEALVASLQESAKTTATQLDALKKSAGDNDELKKQIEALEQQSKTDRAAFEKELAQVRLMAAVDAELTAMGSKNNTAVKAVLADFLKDAKVVDGKVTSKDATGAVTLAARVEAMKKDATTDFLFGEVKQQQREGWKPGEGGDNGNGKQGAGKKPSEMSYSELAAYLAANPDAKLDD